MIVFPTKLSEAVGRKGEIRAGGTDLQERRQTGISRGDLVDLRDVPGLRSLKWQEDGPLRIGARVTIQELAKSEKVRSGYPGLAEAAGGLATPQIRAVATVGGNLLQHTRCWYYRGPEAQCLRKGGSTCFARGGDHLYHACFDTGPCIAVHASTLGMVALAYDAQVEIEGAKSRSVAELYGDGSVPRDHGLESGALLTELVLPPPSFGEQSAYFRAISRAQSEWPLCEVLVRLVVEGGKIQTAAVAMGGVAVIPMRLPEVEAALVGQSPGPRVFAAAAKKAGAGASPLPMTEYKVQLCEGTVLETLERAHKKRPVDVAPIPKPKKTKLPPPAADEEAEPETAKDG